MATSPLATAGKDTVLQAAGIGGSGTMGIKDILTNPSLLKTGSGLLQYLTAGQQSGQLEDYFKQLQSAMDPTNNPFTKRALDFYDTYSQEGAGLPPRYQSILDYVKRGAERQGVAQHGGTSANSGATADIMASAVSRTFGQLFDQDLSTLISGIGPSSGLAASALGPAADIASGMSQATGSQGQAQQGMLEGGLGFLSDVLFK